MAKYAIDENKKRKLDDLYLKLTLEENDRKPSKGIIGCEFTCSIFYDDDFWYVKFFPNYKWQYEVINEMSPEFEDFHYQDQTDPPDDMEYEEFEKRGRKWDKLLESSGGNYRDGFNYVIFDAHELCELIRKNYYTGKTDYYSHLAYKFDSKFV